MSRYSKKYIQHLSSAEWAATAATARKLANYRCQLCGRPGRLEVHHKTYAHLGFEWPDDVIVLCENCHAAFHRKLVEAFLPFEDWPDPTLLE